MKTIIKIFNSIKSYYDDPDQWQKNFERNFSKDKEYFVKYIDVINKNIDFIARKDRSINNYRNDKSLMILLDKIPEEKLSELYLISNKIHQKTQELLFDKYAYSVCSDLYLYSNFLYEIFSDECRQVINYTNSYYNEVLLDLSYLKNAELEYIGATK